MESERKGQNQFVECRKSERRSVVEREMEGPAKRKHKGNDRRHGFWDCWKSRHPLVDEKMLGAHKDMAYEHHVLGTAHEANCWEPIKTPRMNASQLLGGLRAVSNPPNHQVAPLSHQYHTAAYLSLESVVAARHIVICHRHTCCETQWEGSVFAVAQRMGGGEVG